MKRLGFLCLLALAMPATGDTADRIVSLGGSVTEIVVALGAGDRLVARDSTSTYPDSVLALPDVGYVRALSAEGVLSVQPTLILAEEGAGPPEMMEVLQAAGVRLLSMPDVPSREGVLNKITAVAAALDLSAEGARLAADVSAGFDTALAQAKAVQTPKRVLFILSLQGGRVMAGGAGTAAEGIIALAGGVNAAAGFDGYKPMTDEAVLAAAPEVILMMDREGDLEIGNADLMAQLALAASPAAAAGAIVRMDGMLLLGFGPRTPDAALALNAALYGPKGWVMAELALSPARHLRKPGLTPWLLAGVGLADEGGGVFMVMHDLNLTAHVAQNIAFVIDGRIAAAGSPDEVITATRLGQAYGCTVAMNTAPASGPWFVPQCCALGP